MPTWVTHMMIADEILSRHPALDRRSFSVGNIAPDCNIENADWTAFTPPREVTHWMQGGRKSLADSDSFREKYLAGHEKKAPADGAYSFLLGYYVHLLTDGAFQAFIRDEERVRHVWQRIHADPRWCEAAEGCAESWDAVKRLIPREQRMREMDSLEAEYLAANPGSAYFTEILPLQAFPDYLDYLPHGCIPRKIRVMGYIPQASTASYVAVSREEYAAFVQSTVDLVETKFAEHGLL